MLSSDLQPPPTQSLRPASFSCFDSNERLQWYCSLQAAYQRQCRRLSFPTNATGHELNIELISI